MNRIGLIGKELNSIGLVLALTGILLASCQNQNETQTRNEKKTEEQTSALNQAPGTKHNPAGTIILGSYARRIAGIREETAVLEPFSRDLVLTGESVIDPRDLRTVSSWVSGRIDRMYVRNPGEFIRNGEKLYDLYSPELLASEQDYLLALRQEALFRSASGDISDALRAMKNKLLRWGLSESRIDSLPMDPPQGEISIYSRVSGYLVQKLKEEGDYVSEGAGVLTLTPNQDVLVQGQLFDTDMPLLSRNPEVRVRPEGAPGEELPGKIVFDNPQMEPGSRVYLLQVAVPNPGNRLQPGMLAYMDLITRSGRPELIIPRSAVIYEGSLRYVWIRLSDSAFLRKPIRTGPGGQGMVSVLRGLDPGDRVVSRGAYLLNSQYILEYGGGANMSGMVMSDMKISGKGK